MKCGLKCFGCFPDPLGHLRYLGIDLSRFYGPCGKRLCIMAFVLVVIVWLYMATPARHLYGSVPMFSLAPWIMILFALGCYLLLLVCSTHAGIRLIMSTVGKTQADPHRARRVRSAYRRIGNLDEDLSVLDANSEFLLQNLMKDHDELVREALQRGFNNDFLERVRGDVESQRFLLGACILALETPKSFGEKTHVHEDDDGKIVVCSPNEVPNSKKHISLDTALRGSGIKEEIALSTALLPPSRSRAVLLSWAMGKSIDAKRGVNFAWVKQGLGKALNQTDEMNAVRLFVIPPLPERQRTVEEYDALLGSRGSFVRHVKEGRMNEDFRVALLALAESIAFDDVGRLLEALRRGLASGNSPGIITALCRASDTALRSIPESDKNALRVFFHSEQVRSDTEARQSAKARVSALPVAPSKEQSALSGWLSKCAPQAVDKLELIVERAEQVQQLAEQAVGAVVEAVGDLAEAIRGPRIDHLVHMLLASGEVHASQEADLGYLPVFSDRYMAEVRYCLEEGDPVGLVGLLLDLDEDSRLDLRREYSRQPPRSFSDEAEDESFDVNEEYLALPRDICRHRWHMMELVLLGMCMPPYWVWARTLYEACFGGITGLGTDEETLTAVLALNWHQKPMLRKALLHIVRWKGKTLTMEQIIEREIENPHFKRLLLHLLVEE